MPDAAAKLPPPSQDTVETTCPFARAGPTGGYYLLEDDVVTRDLYSKITEFNVISPTEFQMVFSEVFAPYRELWAGTSTTVDAPCRISA